MLRLGSGIVKDVPVVYSGAAERQNGKSNGTPKSKGTGAVTPNVQIRCFIVTGGLDC
jgi:hypothetical protein